MTCEAFADLAPDLALGLLAGPERAQALSHALACRSCREDLAALSAAVDELTLLAPAVEPPVGFEGRVVGSLAGGQTRVATDPTGVLPRPARRRFLAAAAAVVAALAAGLATGWEVGARHPASPAPAAAEVVHGELSAAGRPVGEVIADGGTPAWLYMTVDMGHMNGAVECVLRAGGRTVPVGSFGVTDGVGYWSAPLSRPLSALTSALLEAPGGKVLASAELAPG